MTTLLDRQLIFITGKGGVGKTTVAASLALLASQHGKRVLVGEVDAKGNLADFFETSDTTFKPREVAPNLFAMSMHTEESLKEYLRLQLKVPVLARLGPLARTFDFVAQAAPGVKEVLTVGKFLHEVRERHYDLVVVDAAATGHVVAQLAAPQHIRELVKVGMVHDQTGWMLDILGDPARTTVAIVASPEEMPVSETLELSTRITAETNVDLAAIIQDPLVEIYVLYAGGVPAGFSELDRHTGTEVELAYFGLAPEFIGRGLGRFLLHWSRDAAWRHGPSRLWVHTCNLDHPGAFALYQRAGFVPYRQEPQVIDDPNHRPS